MRKIVVDDVTSEMRDVKNELLHVRELPRVLVRRERCKEAKAEIAARRLDKLETERDEDEAECEANLEEALTDQSKVIVDKWFVDKSFGWARSSS